MAKKNRAGYRPVKYTSHEQDKKLVQLALEGDAKAYNTLAEKYKPILYTAAKRRLPDEDPDNLEDIVMVVMGTAFVKIKQYDPEKSKFFTWMIACLHNYVNSIPKQKKRVQADSLNDLGVGDDFVEYQIPDEHQFDLDYDREQSHKLLRSLIKKLPEDIRTAIYMKYFKEASNKEIADVLGCGINDIWYKIKRGKELLKRLTTRNNLF